MSVMLAAGCTPFCKKDSTLPDLLFEALTVVAEAYVPGSGQVVEIVTPYLNAALDEQCDRLNAGATERQVAMYYRANANAPFEEVDFAIENSQDTVSRLALPVEALDQGQKGSKIDRFAFSTNGEYAVEEVMDIANKVEERNEGNNNSGQVPQENRMQQGGQRLIVKVDLGPSGQRRAEGKAVTVAYLGSR